MERYSDIITPITFVGKQKNKYIFFAVPLYV